MTFNRDIQCLRGISVLLIVFVHSGVFYSILPLNLAPNGFIGVDLFFVISGYIITKSISQKEDRGQFFVKRIFRLLPLALFWMFLHSVLSYIANNLNLTTDYLRPTSEIVTEALNFISLTTNENMGSGLPHYWSLVVEWHFYIIVMLFLPLVRSNRGLKIALAILFISAFINLYPFFTGSNFSTVYRIFEFELLSI